MEKTNMVKLTGLWKNEGKDGKTFLTGSLSPAARLVVLPNTFKKSDKDPDYTAFIAATEPKKDGQTAGRALEHDSL